MVQTTVVINSSDFTHSRYGTGEREWTVGALRHLITALNGQPVALTTNWTGHTVFGVVLMAVGLPMYGTGFALTYSDEHGNHSVPLSLIGTAIMPLPHDMSWDVKGRALDSYRKESAAAIEHVWREGHRGTFEATPNLHSVYVRVTPEEGGANPTLHEVALHTLHSATPA
jgi:hypothetical protein